MSARNPGIHPFFFIRRKADAPTEIPMLRSVLTIIERRAGILETISTQPTATLRYQSVHNEES